MFNTNLVVTIAQEEGSRGREIAEGLARGLHLNYVDEAVINLATQNLTHSEKEAYIRELARRGRVVFLNCGANFILHDFTGVLNVLIEAPLSYRIEQTLHEQHLTQPDAEAHLNQLDRCYEAYVRQYYGPDWKNPDLYDLLLNTERLDSSATVALLSQAVRAYDQGSYQVRLLKPDYVPSLNTPTPAHAPTNDDDVGQRYQRVAELLRN